MASEDESVWCDFHRDHGHKTEDCIALKIKVNELLKKGHLREFLSEKAKNHLSKKTMGKPTEATPFLPPRQDRKIHVISGSSEISGISHAAEKKHMERQARPRGGQAKTAGHGCWTQFWSRPKWAPIVDMGRDMPRPTTRIKLEEGATEVAMIAQQETEIAKLAWRSWSRLAIKEGEETRRRTR